MREEAELAGVPMIAARAYPEMAQGIEEQAGLVLTMRVRYGAASVTPFQNGLVRVHWLFGA